MSIPLITSEGVQTILHSDLSVKEKAVKIKKFVDEVNAQASDGYFKRQNVDRIERLVSEWELERLR